MLYRATIAAMALVVTTPTNAGVFKDDTDRFTGNRSVTWNSLPSQANEYSFSTAALYLKGSSKPGYYRLQLMTWSNNAEFRNCHHTNWLVDGVLDPYLNYDYSATSAGSAIIERFDKQVDRANLQRLASAKLIEFQVCSTEGKISQSDMEGMRKVLDATK